MLPDMFLSGYGAERDIGTNRAVVYSNSGTSMTDTHLGGCICGATNGSGKRRPRADGPLPSRLRRLLRSYLANLPVNFESRNVFDVYGASRHFGRTIVENEVGLLRNTGEQIRTSLRILRS